MSFSVDFPNGKTVNYGEDFDYTIRDTGILIIESRASTQYFSPAGWLRLGASRDAAPAPNKRV